MISLQDSPCLYGWYSCLFIACVLVFFLSLSLSPLSSFYVCRHIQRAIHKLKFIAFFKMNVCFCKKQLAMQVPAKRNAGCSIGFECLISHWLTRRGGRTYVRTVGHKWRHNLTKIFRMHAFTIFSYPWCFAARCARGAPLEMRDSQNLAENEEQRNLRLQRLRESRSLEKVNPYEYKQKLNSKDMTDYRSLVTTLLVERQNSNLK